MASTIDTNRSYAIQGQTLQDICDSVSNSTGSEDVPVSMIPKMIDGINLKYEDIKDVMFMDYNGDLLYSYDKQDFIDNVTALPAGPTWHSNLTFQEWNWDLADIKTELTKTGACCIGACYTTKDGASHFYIDIEDVRDLSIVMYISRISSTVSVDWGDGTSNSYSSNQGAIHTYSDLGKYDIKVTNSFYLANTNYFLRRYPGAPEVSGNWYMSENKFLKRAELGANCKIQANGTFAGFPFCPNLLSVSIHKDVIYNAESLTNFNEQAMFTCDSSLRFFVFPKSMSGMTSTVTYVMLDAFIGTSNLVSVSFPKNCQVVARSNMFGQGGTGIRFLYIPYVQTVTCSSTSYYPIFSTARQMQRFAWAFDSSSIAYSNGWYQTFYCSYNMKKISLDKMNISAPNRYTCYGNELLEGEITLPSSWTVFTGENFYNCRNVTKFTMLGNVTAVGVAAGQVFNSCCQCLCWDFTHCTSVPSLYSTNCFNGIRPTAKIVVPDSLVSSWKTATNWSTYADRIIGESDYNA